MLDSRTSNYINGLYEKPNGTGRGLVTDPSTGEQIWEFTHASDGDVTRAIEIAAGAQRRWSRTPADERIAIVDRWADLIEQQAEELTLVEVSEIGTPVTVARMLQINLAVNAIRAAVRGAHRALAADAAEQARVIKQPVGVVAAITPWNYPLFQTVLKVAPALIAGCTVVLKPAEVAPIGVLRIAELLTGAGLPDGVLNVVNGPGATVGQSLVSNRLIDFSSFTGSFAGGSAVAAAAARNCRPVALELGGKSASVVLDTEYVAAATRMTWASSLQNAGQTCAALTRLIVPTSHLEEVIAIVEEQMNQEVLGSAHSPETTVGPLVSERQQKNVTELLESVDGRDASFVGRSPFTVEQPTQGWFVPPTAVLVHDDDARIAKDEIFGPVLCIIPVKDDSEAIRVAENTDLGLIARVWTADDEKFAHAVENLRVGSVMRNDVATDWSAPFGGVKDSGYGRERGAWGVSEYLVEKSITE